MVLVGKTLRRGRIAGRQGLDDLAVLLEDLGQATGERDADVPEPVAGIVEVLEDLLEARGVGRLPDGNVKLPVAAQNMVQVGTGGGRLFHVFDERIQAVDIGGRKKGRGEASRQAFQDGADVVDLHDLLLGELADHCAAVGGDTHEAGDLQPAQRLAHGHPARTKFLGQLVGDQALARGITADLDSLPDRVIDDFLHRLVGRRHGEPPSPS